ncbi:redoxin [Leptospira fainei serovar Hurstbridge str. BUT 6]|uniref:thioredoxin-dependent peroxiredoxin n=1 Tax=Leptospira fainei serovar Hurstbridge str. BUT 6 TaxID=1193011 RepID=S3VWY6_9LEPT|nr:peroxiredoxin [Leptospira fainei]EPG72647.1 redoxin [Leptospira fainei serovar Hurstbridge str. BUT 6]
MVDKWEGKKLPDVSLESSTGGTVHLPKDAEGSWTLLYFYPKDDTPGCTKQACSYRDHLEDFRKAGAKVFGISSDSLDSHQNFINKFNISFPLLSDPHQTLSGQLGVYGDQEWQGRVFKGLSRDTFLVGPDGTIKKVWRKVDPTKTVSETLDEILKAARA